MPRNRASSPFDCATSPPFPSAVPIWTAAASLEDDGHD